MQSRWPITLGLAASLAVMGGLAQAQPAPPMLSEDDARDPAAVVRWLQTHQVKDRQEVQWFFMQGMRERQRGNLSAAVKAFGESMVRYPSPQALSEYADTQLRMLSQVRSREGNLQDRMQADMALTLDFYRSALAANSVLGTLTEAQKNRLQGQADCVAAFVATGQVDSARDCPPLSIYAPPP